MLAARAINDPRSLRVRNLALSQIRGVLNPLQIRAAGLQFDARDALVISGFPRSGTTWLAQTLASSPGLGVLFEPMNLLRVREARAAGCRWENFREPSESWPEGEVFFRAVFGGRVLNRWTVSHLPLSKARQVERWVVKFVRANQLLGWIINHFLIAPPVLVIRHPCAVYSSWIQRGWPVSAEFPHWDPFFRSFPSFRDTVLRLTTPEERLAAQWSMHYYTAFQHLEPRHYLLSPYERLVRDGRREVDRILSVWGVPQSDGLSELLSRPSGKASGQVAAEAGQRPPDWTRRLPTVAIDRILRVLSAFGFDFYTEEAEPRYDQLPPDLSAAK